MSLLVLARVLPAVALLPLGSLGVRLGLGLGAALFLSPQVPETAVVSLPALLSEAALGATLGLLAGLPVQAARTLDGPLEVLAAPLAWAVFFAVGGPLLWLVALGQSFQAVPPVFSPAMLAEGGAGLFVALLWFGLPTWLTALVVGPLAGLVDRLSLAGHGSTVLAVRPLLALLGVVALLPVLLEVLGDLWRAALGG